MCWNQAVSLNTFLFSSFVLGLVIYNNAYTQYKIECLNNIWIYVFMLSIISIQLIEFFIWRNITNSFYNRVFTWVANTVLVLEPLFSLMLITNDKIKYRLIPIYLFLLVPYIIYQIIFMDIHSEISKKGHLSWKLANLGNSIPWIVWLFFFSFSFIYSGKYVLYIFVILLLALSYYNYKQEQSIGSMWCWMTNSIAIYLAFYLLFYLPFVQGNKGSSVLRFC